MNASVYLEGAEESLERLLSNMDRNHGSPTFGCLARPYWHDKATDFPSAHQQIGVFPLALAYTQDWDGNPFHGSDEIRTYIDAALAFWTRIQHRNGSFDEHYPNEHSVGAAAWTLWAVTETYLLLDDPPAVEPSIERAAEFLATREEPGDIANHQAVAATALLNAHRITGTGRAAARRRLETLQDMRHPDGWFQEYTGADIGYQSTTISHLGRAWARDADLVEREMVADALDFLATFIDAEGYYAGTIGSRNTEHLHVAGIELLADEFDTAARIAAAARRNMANGHLLTPGRMDDKHFSRQLAEYLDAYRHAGRIEASPPTVDDTDYDPISVVTAGDGSRLYVNVSKGGVYHRYRDGELVDRDLGPSARHDGDIYTANWPGVTERAVREDDRIVVEGALRRVPVNTVGGYRFLALRLFNRTLGRLPSLSLAVKDHLIDRLIGEGGGVPFRREIAFGDGVDVDDRFEGAAVDGTVRSNFVPSSEFFAVERLDTGANDDGAG